MSVALTPENLSWLVERYSNDIAAFGIDIMGFERFDPWQEWLFSAILDPDQRKIAVASCHSSGKTLNSCLIALHRLLCYPEARVLITSATEGQLKAAFVTTLHSMIEKSLIKDWFNVTSEQITLRGVEESWIRLRAWSENRPESFAGVHCTSPMFIFDEASGISPKIYEAVTGSMMHPFSQVLLLGNPLHRKGELFDAFNLKKDFYSAIHVSAYDSSFIDPKWIQEMKDTYGENSNIFRVRVLGIFPTIDIDTFIPEQLIKNAIGRTVHVDIMDDVVGGLDVGKYHDASVLVIRKGNKVTHIIKYRTRDLMTLSELVGQEIVKHNISRVAVDANGIGSGVADRLRQMHAGKVFDVRLGNLSPDIDKTYYNGRAKYWGMAKKWLNYGSLPESKDLVEEGSSLLYDFDIHGRYQLERKKDAIKRGIHSPDHFDAFAYTFAIPVQQAGSASKIEDNYVEIAW